MKKILAYILCVVLSGATAFSRGEKSYCDRTLRIDYIFSGTDSTTQIALGQLSSFEGWAGRTHNMDSLPLKGNGQIVMRDAKSSEVLYMNSFSTLFQEWQCTEEAVRIRRSFENVFLLPMPLEKVIVSVELFGFKGESTAYFEHEVDPSDILIRKRALTDAPYRYLLHSGPSSECIDIAIVAEGYVSSEAELFFKDATLAMNEILSYEPFASLRDNFNFIAVAPSSNESGVSIPSEGDWKDTALGASFSTFYSDRYLTTLHLNKLHDVLSALSWFTNSATALLVWQMSIIMTINITNCPGNRPFPGQFSAFIHFVRKIGLPPDGSFSILPSDRKALKCPLQTATRVI